MTANPAYVKLATALNEAVAAGKILDVSGLKPDATGARKINMPKTAKGKKRWVDNFPIVSDNYASYALAMQILGNDYLPLAEKYRATYGDGIGLIGTQAPKVTTAKSPAKLGAPLTAFPVYANTPAPITIAHPTGGAKTPRAPKTPGGAKTPRAPKSPAVRQTAILNVPVTGQTTVTTIPNFQVTTLQEDFQPNLNTQFTPGIQNLQLTNLQLTNLQTNVPLTPKFNVPVPKATYPGTVMMQGVPTVPLVQGTQRPQSPQRQTAFPVIPPVKVPSPRGVPLTQSPGRVQTPQSPRVLTIPQPVSPRQIPLPQSPIPSPGNDLLIQPPVDSPRGRSPNGSPQASSPRNFLPIGLF